MVKFQIVSDLHLESFSDIMFDDIITVSAPNIILVGNIVLPNYKYLLIS